MKDSSLVFLTRLWKYYTMVRLSKENAILLRVLNAEFSAIIIHLSRLILARYLILIKLIMMIYPGEFGQD